MDKKQIDLRNETLYSAMNCFEENHMPIHFVGCNEKYRFQMKYGTYDRVKNYFMSICLTGTDKSYYASDQEDLVI